MEAVLAKEARASENGLDSGCSLIRTALVSGGLGR